MRSISPSAPPVPTREGLLDAVVQSAFTTMAVLTKVAADHDLSLTQLRVLAILRDRRLKMTGLAGYLGLEKSTMTGLVERAERRGLLARAKNDEDRRAVDVFITPAGAELADKLRAVVTQHLGPSLDRLAPGEQRSLHGLLGRTFAPYAGGPRRSA